MLPSGMKFIFSSLRARETLCSSNRYGITIFCCSSEKLMGFFGIKLGNLPGYIQILTSTALCVSTPTPPTPNFGSRGRVTNKKKQLLERRGVVVGGELKVYKKEN